MGAGFAKNWGGYLAREVWERLLARPSVRSSDVLRRCLLDNPEDFEGALAHIRMKKPRLAGAMEQAVLEVFREQDDNEARDWFDFQSENFHDFMNKFRDAEGTALLFTLNQDILVERRWREGELWAPGVGNLALEEGRARTDAEYQAKVPPGVDVRVRTGAMNYVKLHGSFVWTSESGNSLLVAGTDKAHQIAREFSILNGYLRLFRDACRAREAWLVVVGYSFRDPHINEIIAASARKGLKLAVMDTRSPVGLKTQLEKEGHPETWNALVDYCSVPMLEVLRGCPGAREIIASSTGVK